MTTKNGAFAPMAKLGPKNVHSPDEILGVSLKEIGVAKDLDDLVLSGLIGRKEYRQNCVEIAHTTEAVRLILEAHDEQSH